MMRRVALIILMFAIGATAQPAGVDISARDGDRIFIEDTARIQVVRRRQATIRAIYSQKEGLLIVLVDYVRPGAFPDGQVDWAFNFYQLEGAWPLAARWEALTAILEYEGATSRPRGFALETPTGLVQLLPQGSEAPDPRAVAVLTHRGASSVLRQGVSFDQAEKIQLQDFVRSKGTGSTFSTLTGPAGSGSGTASVAITVGPAMAGGSKQQGTTPPAPAVAMNPSYVPPPGTVRKPPPPGREIQANDGDRVVVEDDSRVQIVRRRQAMVRVIFRQEQRLLIVLADYPKPGEPADGIVDATFSFKEVEGGWPLAPRWDALTTMFHYEGDRELPGGYAIATPQGLIHLSPGRAGVQPPEPNASAIVWYRGSSLGQDRGWSFAQAEKYLLAEAAKQ